ncbi:MAG: hypothetical protein GY861_22420 [bacterium]|nr:hypothetical protein [bacterium]
MRNDEEFKGWVEDIGFVCPVTGEPVFDAWYDTDSTLIHEDQYRNEIVFHCTSCKGIHRYCLFG